MKNTLRLSEKINPSFSIEIKRCRERTNCIIFGVLLIFEYSKELVELHTHAGKIKITGNSLEINVFKDGAVEILGGMENISFV